MIAEELQLQVAHPVALGLGYRRRSCKRCPNRPPMRRCRPLQRDVVRVVGRPSHCPSCDTSRRLLILSYLSLVTGNAGRGTQQMHKQ
eukprot:scaffold101833_cov72-Phaeocystis_antarctica.AAC.2